MRRNKSLGGVKLVGGLGGAWLQKMAERGGDPLHSNVPTEVRTVNFDNF
jgi:hypothetical protein